MTFSERTFRRQAPGIATGAIVAALAVLAGCSSSGSDDDSTPQPSSDDVAPPMPGDVAIPTDMQPDAASGMPEVGGVDQDPGETGVPGAGDDVAAMPPVIEPMGSSTAADEASLVAFLTNPDVEAAGGDVVVAGPGAGASATFNAWRCRTDTGSVEYWFQANDPEDTSETLASSSGFRYEETTDFWARFNFEPTGNDALMFDTNVGVREQDRANFQPTTGELTTIRTGPGRAWSAFDSLAQSALACTEVEVSRAGL